MLKLINQQMLLKQIYYKSNLNNNLHTGDFHI